jgi:hypothetical protein
LAKNIQGVAENKGRRNTPSKEIEIQKSTSNDEPQAENQNSTDPYGSITDNSFKEILKRLERSIKDKNNNR